MAKAPVLAPTTETPATQPKATDVLVAVTELVTPYRFPDRTVNLGDLARIVSASSRILRFNDLDERISTENAALLAIAKKRGLITA